MANVVHSALTGVDLHESKGAASAALGQVAVATGAGTAVFQSLPYNYLSGKPNLIEVSYSGSVITGVPLIKHYLVTGSGGLWTQALSGFTQIHSVHAQVIGSTSGNSSASWTTTITALSTSSVSGQVWSVTGTASASSQQIYLTVYGV